MSRSRPVPFALPLAVLGLLVAPPRAAAKESALWQQFLEAKKTGGEPVLPDFSYAGYRRGERAIPDVEGEVFDVTAFGAVADDEGSDQEAIQKALDAAAAAGGGVVRFPKGRFLINKDEGAMRSLVLRAGHVVLRGAGSGKGGTVIEMVHPREPTDPAKMYSTPWQISLGASGSDRRLARVTADARRETFTVEVDDAKGLAVGGWVTLSLKSKEAVPDYLAPYEPDKAWTRLFETGVCFEEPHRIAAIDGRRVTFEEPIRAGVQAKHGWELKTYAHVEEVGVEDICFVGAWRGPFKHHRSALDDSGSSALALVRVANGWVRRCAFVGWNQGLHLTGCASVSVLQVRFAGARGHGAVYVRGGEGILVGLARDEAGHHHGPSVGYRSSGVVFWRYEMAKGQPIDSHSGTPIATLLDRADGGKLRGSGGPREGLPNHLRHYVIWNFRHGDGAPRVYDFWARGGRDTFVMPVIVGLHGTPVKIDGSRVYVNESQGDPVEPESLYEAQLAARLGALPAWVAAERARWAALRDAELPAP